MNLLEKIKHADSDDMNDILLAVLARYRELFPEWEISTVSIEKKGDRNQQLDSIIELLKKNERIIM